MGAGTALLTLPGEPGIRAAVLESPYASACDLIAIEIARRTILPEWFAPVFIPGATFMARMLYDIDVGALTPKRSAAELDYPVLVIHGTADTRVPFEHGRRVYHAAPEGSELWSPDGMWTRGRVRTGARRLRQAGTRVLLAAARRRAALESLRPHAPAVRSEHPRNALL